MTKEDILLSLFKLRGTTLCLGESIDVTLGMLDIPMPTDIEIERLICVPTENYLSDKTIDLFIKGKKWKVFLFPYRHISNKITACLSTENFLNDVAEATSDKYKKAENPSLQKNDEFFYNYIQSLWITNIWMVDTFPFHTKELVNNINRIKDITQTYGLEFGVALLSGLRRYGSTDISTEPEAVSKEKKELSKRGISCVEVKQTLSLDQIINFFTPNSSQLYLATERFKSDCKRTLENLEMSKEILGSIFLIGVNMSLKEYIIQIKKTMSCWSPMFPITKYLDNTFYQKFEDAIISKFNSKNEADNMALSNRFAETFYHALKNWIIRIYKYNQI